MAGRNEENFQRLPVQSTHTNCPQTWKVAVSLLLVCALFLTGVVIGYLISQANGFKELDCDKQQKTNVNHKTDSSSELTDGILDPRLLKQRHWDLVDYIATDDYVGSPDFM